MIKSWLRKEISKKFSDIEFDILTPPDDKMGDYSVNLAFVLAKKNGTSPAEEGEKIVEKFKTDREFSDRFGEVNFINPGFVNLKLADDFLRDSVKDVFAMGDEFGASDIGKGKKINLEFVSANPTGPLTLANGRGGFWGDVLANILERVGYDVEREYYINDTGRQISILGFTVGKAADYKFSSEYYAEEDLYKGRYILDLAKRFKEDELSKNPYLFPEDIGGWASKIVLSWIKESLTNAGIEFDTWFSERDHLKQKDYQKIIDMGLLKPRDDGAYTLKDEGSFLIRSVGTENIRKLKIGDTEHEYSVTYFFSDLAYHYNKFLKRGFDFCINIWGADHHGHVARLKKGIEALGINPERQKIIITQFVRLVKDGKEISMSKRKGEFVTLGNLIEEVGKDVVRFFFLMISPDTHMDFDLKLAKEQSKKNPVFYIQYAFARLSSIAQKAGAVPELDEALLQLLKEEEELKLLRDITKLPDLVEELAENYHVHHLAQYTLDLASDFHKFYEKHRVIIEDKSLQSARLLLSGAVRKVLAVCLNLMGLSAPEKM